MQHRGVGLGHLLVEGVRGSAIRATWRGAARAARPADGDLAAVAVGQGPVEEEQVVGAAFAPGHGKAVEELDATAHRFHVVEAGQLEHVDEGQARLVVVGNEHAQGR